MTSLYRSSVATRCTRRGFTLTELLVVIAIMAILASLITAGVQRARVGQTVRDSESTVAKVQDAVQRQLQAIEEGVAKERTTQSAAYQAMKTFCNGDDGRAQALLTYCRVKQAFPQTVAEITAPFSLGGVNFPVPAAFTDPSLQLATMTGNADHISAVLLRVAVTKRTIQGYTFAAGDGIGNAEGIIQLGNAQYPVFTDGWKQPVALRRWFTSPELNNPPYINPKDTSRDPFDPQGRLDVLVATWPNRATAEGVLGVTFSNANNKRLVVFSGGANQTYDNLAADDILGFRLASIGKKGTP